ncbi:MAG: TonB-dependent receptor [Alistipes sp.]|nr:TonB-dependent receptor [Alistipes sp.]
MEQNYRLKSLYRYVMSFLLLAAVTASPLRGQARESLDLSLEGVTVQDAITELYRKYNYSIAVRSGDLDLSRRISVNVRSATVGEVLDLIFAGQPVAYTINGRSISVTRAEPPRQTAAQSARQANRVSGLVTDQAGNPVPGCAVILEDNSTGRVTNAQGEFWFDDLDLPTTLTFSFLGYHTQTLAVAGYGRVHVVLEESTDYIDEVVVVGYGTQVRANLTGAVSTISSKELNDRPVVSAAQALQGADPSVNLFMSTGSPESGYSVDIRGALSINDGSPLVLADGIEVSLSQINPNDIESVTILKDASSAAIYGAKASAGVILITTKSGARSGGKTSVRYSGRMGWAMNTTSTDFITNGYDYVTLANTFYNAMNGVNMYDYTEENGGLQKLRDRYNDKTEHPDRPWTEVGDDGKYYYYGNFDWFGYFYNRVRSQHEHNLSVTGGDEKFNYYVSGRNLNQNGIFNIYKDTYTNYSYRAKMSAQVKSWMSLSTNISYDRSEYKYAGRYNYHHTIAALQSNVSPTFLPRNPDGSIVQYTNQLYANSPIGAGHGGFLTADNTRNSRENRYLTINNQIDIDITKDLVLTGTYGYRTRDRLYRYRNNTFEYSRQEGVFENFSSGSVENSYEESTYRNSGNNYNVYATYKHSWNNAHNFTAVAGAQYEDYRSTTTGVYQTDLTNDDLATFAVATGVSTITQSIASLKTMGMFARLNYDYKGRYLFEASFRADGSSRFRKGDRWGYFPSASAGWRISDEEFFGPVSSVWSNLKLRFSVGSLGNQQMSSYYPYIDQLSIDNVMNYTFDGLELANYASVSAPNSTDLTWETVTTYDVGVDMSFLRHRLTLTGDYYIRDTRNMLTTSITLPSVYGATTPKANCADLRTKGYEITAGWRDRFRLLGSDFNYGVTASIGDYKTKITKYNNPDKLISDYYEGMTLGEIWGYKVEGLFKTDREAAEYQARIDDSAVNQRVYNSKGEVGGYLRAGDVKFMDLDGDGVISAGSGTVADPGDKRIIGNSNPRYNYSFRLEFSWHGIDASAFFQGVGRQNWFPANGQSSYDFWGPYAFPSTSFIHTDFLTNGWTEDNRNAYFPRQRGYQAYSGGSLGEVNDRYLQNVAYLRLKNLTVGYTLPVAVKHIDRVRVAFSGENLTYWSALKKHSKTVDPELAVTSGTYNSDSGTGYFYPKTFSVSIEITF